MPWTETTVATERLTLRPFVEADKSAIIALRTDELVRRFLGGAMGPEAAEEIRSATVGEQWGVFGVVLDEPENVIGAVSFGRQHGELEISYEFLPDYWGKGLATEAVGAALGWVTAHTDADEIIAVTQTANMPSVALLERLGFERERTFEEFDAEQGQFRRQLRRTPTGG